MPYSSAASGDAQLECQQLRAVDNQQCGRRFRSSREVAQGVCCHHGHFRNDPAAGHAGNPSSRTDSTAGSFGARWPGHQLDPPAYTGSGGQPTPANSQQDSVATLLRLLEVAMHPPEISDPAQSTHSRPHTDGPSMHPNIASYNTTSGYHPQHMISGASRPIPEKPGFMCILAGTSQGAPRVAVHWVTIDTLMYSFANGQAGAVRGSRRASLAGLARMTTQLQLCSHLINEHFFGSSGLFKSSADGMSRSSSSTPDGPLNSNPDEPHQYNKGAVGGRGQSPKATHQQHQQRSSTTTSSATMLTPAVELESLSMYTAMLCTGPALLAMATKHLLQARYMSTIITTTTAATPTSTHQHGPPQMPAGGTWNRLPTGRT